LKVDESVLGVSRVRGGRGDICNDGLDYIVEDGGGKGRSDEGRRGDGGIGGSNGRPGAAKKQKNIQEAINEMK
jgi:hypothetical protein